MSKIEIPKTSRGWQLYTLERGELHPDSPSSEEVAGTLYRAVLKEARYAMESVFGYDKPAAEALARFKAETRKVFETWIDWGAMDSEPWYELQRIVDNLKQVLETMESFSLT